MLPLGFEYRPDFLTAAAEADLIRILTATDVEHVVFRGQVTKRRVAHFGLRYGYNVRSLEPGPPLPAWLASLRTSAVGLLGLDPALFLEVLVSHYPAGAGIGWHRDAPIFGEPIFGISLGAACRLRFRLPTGEAAEHTVEPRSFYTLAGPARSDWYHHIPPVKAERWSITFRTVRDPPD